MHSLPCWLAAAAACLAFPTVGRGLPAQCALQWRSLSPHPGADGAVLASAMWDPDGAGPRTALEVFGGAFQLAGTTRAARVVAHDPATGEWLPLGPGIVDDRVEALAVLGDGSLVAGSWTMVAIGVAVGRISRWDGSQWTQLGTVTNGPVHDLLTLANGDLLAAGGFTTCSGVTVNGVARWDGSSWSALANGLQASVTALAQLPNGRVLAGGLAVTASSRVAVWDGTAWSPLGALALPSAVWSLAVLANGSVVAGFDGTTVGGVATVAAAWNGTGWAPLAPFTTTHPLGLMSCRALSPRANGDLLLGGAFSGAGGAPASCVVRWSGSGWSALGAGVDATVETLLDSPTSGIVAGGAFTSAGGAPASALARWNGSAWLPLASGFDGAVHAAAVAPNGDVIVGGAFTRTSSGPANRIARWDGTTFHPLGSGTSDDVFAVAVLPNGDVYAGGVFLTAGGVTASRIARWDGAAWSPLGTGVLGPVYAVHALPGGDLAVGGRFVQAGGSLAMHVARWDGSNWFPLSTTPNALSGEVRALTTLPNGDLVAGGLLDFLNLYPLRQVARFDGVAWTPVGGPLYGWVHALATLGNGDLVAGGDFTVAGSGPADRIARWNGTAWVPLGSGLQGWPYQTVRTLLRLPDGDLLAGGSFTSAGPVAAAGVARWDGAAWNAIGSGTLGEPRALALAPRELFVGGVFQTAGGFIARNAAALSASCPATVAVHGAGCSGSAGPNVLAATTLPWIGGTFAARATGLPANAIAVRVLGLGTTSVPLATILPQGGAGCALLATPDLLDAYVPAGGSLDTQFAIPDALPLAGMLLHQQIAALELGPLAAILALTSTNALSLTIGAF
jgi:hypothetical protein